MNFSEKYKGSTPDMVKAQLIKDKEKRLKNSEHKLVRIYNKLAQDCESLRFMSSQTVRIPRNNKQLGKVVSLKSFYIL